MTSMAASTSAYFYPRPPRGGRPPLAHRAEPDTAISIHALREEGDTAGAMQMTAVNEFLSTPSARRATLTMERDIYASRISIHALREEGDPGLPCETALCFSISIHALREEGD